MKYSTLITAVFLPVLAIANPLKIMIESSDPDDPFGTCESGEVYCGKNLLDHHGYSFQGLYQLCESRGCPEDEKFLRQALFACHTSFDLTLLAPCNECLVTPPGFNDRCLFGNQANSDKSNNGDTIASSELGTQDGSCVDGEAYCATDLLDQRGYSLEKLQELSNKQGGPTDEQAIRQSLFTCRGGYYVVWEEKCERGCLVTSPNKDDRCKYGYESNSDKSDNNGIFQMRIGL